MKINKKWCDIWENKGSNSSGQDLKSLILADGYGDSFGHINEQSWEEYVLSIANKLESTEADSFYEVGCGSGAFLYPLHTRGNTVSGIDYSSSLINIANKAMPNCSFETGEALFIKPEIPFDFVLSNGVFLYFPNLDYAQKVIELMIKKSTKGIAILDLNDNEKKNEAISFRKGFLSEDEFKKKYDGLDHLFFDKKWIEDIVKSHGLEVIIEDQNIPNYLHSNFRFNLIARKQTL
jgi:trans-aconitate methyltransferase